MEFVAGECLEKLIRRYGSLNVGDGLAILNYAAGGLDGIWKQNLIHRDIKPSNIMVTTEGDQIVNAKIIDLGLAKSGTEAGASSEVSAMRNICRDRRVRQPGTIRWRERGHSF